MCALVLHLPAAGLYQRGPVGVLRCVFTLHTIPRKAEPRRRYVERVQAWRGFLQRQAEGGISLDIYLVGKRSVHGVAQGKIIYM